MNKLFNIFGGIGVIGGFLLPTDLSQNTSKIQINNQSSMSVVEVENEQRNLIWDEDEACWLTTLAWSVKNGESQTAMKLIELEQEIDINKIYDNAKTLLIMASENGNLDLVKILISKKADAFLHSELTGNALYYATKSGNLDLVKYLLSLGLNPWQSEFDGKSILMQAARSGNMQLVKYLINFGLDINERSKNGLNVLMFASESGNLEMVKFLVNSGLNLSEKAYVTLDYESDYDDIYIDIEIPRYSALIAAAGSGNVNLAKWIIEKGESIKTKQGFYALALATRKGKLEMVRFLLKNDTYTHGYSAYGFLINSAAAANNLQEVKKIFSSNNEFWEPNYWALMTAINSGNDDLAIEIIRMGMSPKPFFQLMDYSDFKFKKRISPLISAAIMGRERIIDEITKYGFSNDVFFAIKMAASRGKLSIVNKLITKNICDCIQQKNRDAYQSILDDILYSSMEGGNVDLVKFLISKGANINATQNSSFYLMNAVKSGHLNIVKYLLANNIDIHKTNHVGDTAFYIALKKHDLQILKELLKYNVGISNEFYHALNDKNYNEADTIIELGIKINDLYYNEKPIVWSFIEKNKIDAIMYMLDNGLNPNQQDDGNQTSLMISSAYSSTNVVQKFIEIGAALETRSLYGETALFYAVLKNNKDTTALLLNLGANPNVINSAGVTPLIYAVQSGNVEIVKILLEKNAEKSTKDGFGKTAFSYAFEQGNTQIISLLQEN